MTFNLNEDEIADMQETIGELIENYLEENIVFFFNDDFQDEMISSISSLVYYDMLNGVELSSEEELEILEQDINELVEDSVENYFQFNRIPKRSNSITFEDLHQDSEEELKDKIEFLEMQEQPEQKTKEWYQFRYNLITASNLWKVFGTDSQVNSLIYEKCKPFEEIGGDGLQSGPLFWGIKYEPITILIYEKMFHTKIQDFGCIKHVKYPYIGASPDGINVNPTSMRYGRMLEIKNIFNREITGVPKKEYWVQMQLQMEVCNLESCDFVETRIKEFENQGEYIEKCNEHEYYGIVVVLMPIFKPCDISSNDEVLVYNKNKLVHRVLTEGTIEEIESQTGCIKEDNENFYISEINYWYLDELSCVFVKRNKPWFEKSLPLIKDVWNIIEKERVDGYEHRASKKRKPSIDNTESPGKCLLAMSDDSC